MQKKNTILSLIALLLAMLFLFSSCAVLVNHPSVTPNAPEKPDESESNAGTTESTPAETKFKDPSASVEYPKFENGDYPSLVAKLSEEELILPTKELVDRIFSREFYNVFYSKCFGQFLFAASYDSTLASCCFDEFGNRYHSISYSALRGSFNGIQELETRPDAAKILLAKYKQSLTDTAFEDYGYLRPQIPAPADAKSLAMPAFLEIVLSQDVFINQLTEAEKAELYETIPKIRGTRGPDDRNANHFDMSYLFFDYYTYKEWKELQGE